MKKTQNQIREIFKSVIRKSGDGNFYAWLGRGDGKVIANDNNGVYIIDYNGNVQVVLNTRVPLYPFRLVEVGYISENSKVLEVKRMLDSYPENRPPAIQNHSKLHEWGGVDTLWVRPEQIMVGLCLPDDTNLFKVHFIGFIYYLSGFHLLDNFSMDMTSEVPSSGAAWVLLQVDESGSVTTVTGTNKDTWQLLEYEDIPDPDADNIPLVAIRLYYGQTRIWKNKVRSDIVDLRWSGYTSGGGGGVESVSGDGVDDTDPANPVISYPTPGDIGADLAGAAATAETNAKAYADGLVVGLWDDRGTYDASGGAYPSSGGSGTAGTILKGDIWTISVAGTLPTGQAVEVGDTVRALVNTPGNTQANWAISQNNIGYVAENSANKTSTIAGNESSTTLYSTIKGIVDWATGLFEVLTNKATTIIGNEVDEDKYPSTSAVYDFALKRDDNFQVNIGEQRSLADDATYSFTPPADYGMILVQSRSAASTNFVLGFYVKTSGGSVTSYVIGSNTELLTGVMPSPTAGTDGKLCVSVDTSGGVIYIRNRTGSTRNIVIKCW